MYEAQGKRKPLVGAFPWVLKALLQGKAVFNPILCLLANKITISPLLALVFQGI